MSSLVSEEHRQGKLCTFQADYETSRNSQKKQLVAWKAALSSQSEIRHCLVQIVSAFDNWESRLSSVKVFDSLLIYSDPPFSWCQAPWRWWLWREWQQILHIELISHIDPSVFCFSLILSWSSLWLPDCAWDWSLVLHSFSAKLRKFDIGGVFCNLSGVFVT